MASEDDDIHGDKPTEETAGRDGRRSRRSRDSAPPEEIKRGNIAVNVAVQLLCAILLFLLINDLSSRNHKRWDLTAAKKYSISEDTKAYLGRLDTRVNLTMAFVGNSKIRNQLQALLEEYERIAGGQIVFTHFDPVRDKARALETTDRYGIPIDQNCVFIDIGGKVKKVTEIDMLDQNGRIFSGEAAITSAMLAATEGRPKTVYLIAGKGKLRSVGGRTALEELIDLSERQFFTLKELTLGNITQIPEDADALLLINPETDLSTGEVDLLTDYWENDRGSLVLLLNPATEMPNLSPFLRMRGVRVDSDCRVMFSQVLGIGGSQKVYSVQARFLEGSPITAGKAGTLTTFGGQTCPLSVAENNTALAGKGVVAKALLEADPKFWGERDHTGPAPSPGAGDMEPPVYVAASVEKGGSDDPLIHLDSSRLVVVGNSTLLDPDHITRSNANFVMNAINWTLDRDERIDIMPKPATNFRIDITPGEYRNLFLLVVILLPAAALCFAVFVWSARRN